MENVMTKGFTDLSMNEIWNIDGGVNWWAVAGGVCCVVSGVVWFCGGPGKVAAGFAIAGGVCTIISAF